MKNKPLTYLLIVSVAAVWGIIFYRVFSASADEEPNFKTRVKSGLVNESLDDYTFKDTFSLALNYRDPFLDQSSKGVETSVISESAVTVTSYHIPKLVKPSVDWTIIKYSGFILNSSEKKRVAILTIGDKEYMLNEGQSAAGVKLLKNMKDSVKVFYQDKTKYIRIQ